MILKLCNRLEAAQEIILMGSDYVNFNITTEENTQVGTVLSPACCHQSARSVSFSACFVPRQIE